MEVVPISRVARVGGSGCWSQPKPAWESHCAHLFPAPYSVSSPWLLKIGYSGRVHNMAISKCYKIRAFGEPVVKHLQYTASWGVDRRTSCEGET